MKSYGPLSMATTDEQKKAARAELARRELARREAERQPAVEKPRPEGNLPFGAFENFLQMGTGAIAAPVSGLAGLVASAIPGGDDPADIVERVGRGLTFEPRTQAGQDVSEFVSRPFELFERFSDTAGEVTGEPEDTLGATAVKTALLSLPAALGLRGLGKKPLTRRQQVAKAAQEEGYVVPPASVSDRFAPGFLEGAGGKLKTQQEASIRNQAVTNRLVSREFNIPEGTPITPEVLAAVRREAGEAYNKIKTSGQVSTDISFRRDLSNVSREFKQAASDFPALAEKPLVKVIDDIAKTSEFNAGSGIQAIRSLRDKADVAYRAGDKSIGNAYKGAADAIEGVMERHLSRSGDPEALANFRNARQTIAKTYSVENALVGGDVSATNLAAQLKKGKPLSGPLETVARFAEEFPKAARPPQGIGSVPAFSPLDLFAGGGGAAAGLATGNPFAALPLATTLSRPLLRKTALGPIGQRSAISNNPSIIKSPFIPGLIGSGHEAEILRKK